MIKNSLIAKLPLFVGTVNNCNGSHLQIHLAFYFRPNKYFVDIIPRRKVHVCYIMIPFIEGARQWPLSTCFNRCLSSRGLNNNVTRREKTSSSSYCRDTRLYLSLDFISDMFRRVLLFCAEFHTSDNTILSATS